MTTPLSTSALNAAFREQPQPRPKTGRPSLFSQERTEAICAIIRAEGISDTAAGALAGVTASTLSRWKLEDEEFALCLDQARAWFELDLVRRIRDAHKRDGSVDWRAAAWLLRHSSADGFGPRSRMRKTKEESRTTARESAGGPAAARANGAIPPESPAHPAEMTEQPVTNGEGEAEATGAFENCAILPKTPAASAPTVAPKLSRQERRAEERRLAKVLRGALREAA